MSLSDKVTELGAWGLENGHRALLAITGGRFPKRVLGMQTLELHTIGRKSGQRRSTMLTAPIYGPDRVVVVASKGGHSDNPDWFKNLAANPDVEITVDEVTSPWTAKAATADEKARLWPQITKAYSGYEGYQKRTERDIPVVVLTPR
ncbi:nitroreductase family deazaflavin-dependent oxidoreductase [Tsukamurella tyrosinosolvens]|uniref:nitroreductase/quinone reductase family protein n=1 Tax=Tsukamurella tyrosinosolvens TaxID=57704 RepID=UPI000793294F|nr:nitroreductase/quinone reductase family protein [Tsukamurella tyrosinosolvens]KXP06225.1 nitroreductase [Tsukamurella tyrosinosolvens]KZL96057.1 nitroreductase [Tsukamurella tyrosinosolvens]MCA4993106.1 nitroreductase family deazaflavin-dependent oxidoreductase [Tsukamurella tyrosinosolvens]MEC4615408.1 nitroreductase/quinone reductase family protein [Tsukamurella tyrosinosolvens]WEL91657.1 nitroreductase/quinone reductase family protein [Tsukamurella tyrosinosolvens]